MWGAEIEQKFHLAMNSEFRELLKKLPCFGNYDAAYSYAVEVEAANKTARKIVVIETYQDLYIKDMHR